MSSASITEDAAREAFIMYAESKCCYRTAPAEDMVITSMEALDSYRYCLKTFTETRSTEQCFEPFIGQQLQVYKGVSPLWDIHVQAPAFFQVGQQDVRVLHSSFIEDCHGCDGRGRNVCEECGGAGKTLCADCAGTGVLCVGGEANVCRKCCGGGVLICNECVGRGFSACLECRASGRIVQFTNLSVEWTNHTDWCVLNQDHGLSMQKLDKVSGECIYSDTQHLVDPVTDLADSDLVAASERLVRQHRTFNSNNSRIRQQMQTIERIPVTRVNYTWEEDSFEFFVFGIEGQVTTDNYPVTCCCCVFL